MAALKDTELSVSDVSGITSLKHPHRLLKSMEERGYIDLFEKVKDKYSPKKEKRVRLTPQFETETALNELLQKLESKTGQVDVLLAYLAGISSISVEANRRGIRKTDLLKKDISASSLKTLMKNGILEEWEEVVSRLEKQDISKTTSLELSGTQKMARDSILESFARQQVALLHGITGSGKTAIYIDLIKKELAKGKQVLYLLPEIALTTQIISRLHRVFGNTFGGVSLQVLGQ